MSDSSQLVMVSLDELVPLDHNYRKFASIFNFGMVERELRSLVKEEYYQGYGVLRLFKCLLLQFMEDLSDRELEKFVRENNSAKWFCDFGLTEKVPDHTVYCKARKKIGTNRLSKIFSCFREQLKQAGYISEIFTFVDATHLISKANLWEERDEAIRQKYEKLNNENISKFSKDPQAKIGCKGGDKFWYGYKKHSSVDMQSGLINKVSVTPANVTDAQGFCHVCPSSGAVYADKGYCTKPAIDACNRKSVYLRAVKKNNMKDKNKDLDRWITHIRSPYERVFSQQNRRVRYKGIAKNQFSEFMNAMCFNLKRLVALGANELSPSTG
jgi:transposase, IS5 family